LKPEQANQYEGGRMAHRFYSKEWLQECIDRVNNDKEYLKKTKKLNFTPLTIVTDCPDGNDLSIIMQYVKGKVVRFVYDAKPSPASFRMETEPWDPKVSLLKAQGSYDTFKKIHLKELTLMDAMMNDLYKSDGDFVKAAAMLTDIDAYMQIQATVPCDF